MDHYLWRMSGYDARGHAFAAQSGFIPPIWTWVPDFGSVECRRTACGHTIPPAFLMPHNLVHEWCPICLHRVGLYPRRPPLSVANQEGLVAV